MSKLLTVAEVAERLRLHPMTVRRHIKSGRIRAMRVGRSVRVPEDSLKATMGFLEPGDRREMTKEEWTAKLLQPPTPEELARRRNVFEEMRRLAVKSDIPSDVLIRAGRRGREVTGGEKTWEELIAEESAPLGD